MVRSWPSTLGRHVRLPAHRAGEIALAAVLVAGLGTFWSDGTPYHDPVIDPAPHAAAFMAPPTMDFGWLGSAVGITRLSFPPPPVPVPTALPATILIPSLNVHRPVESVGVDRGGYMYTPANLWNAGWYKGSPVPGAPGDSVIEGHAGYPDQPLLFGKLKSLRRDDKIIVVLADGSRRLFLVRSVAVWPAWTSPAGLGSPFGDPRLTLVTCTGPFDASYKTYADRLIVEAVYAGVL